MERYTMLELFVRARQRRTFSFAGLLLLTLSAFTSQAAPPGRTDTSAVAHARASQTTPAQTDATATIYGVKIHYVEAGSGPVVVLLHGLGGDTTNWAFNTSALARKYRVIVPDQIGFGK